jgi:hypothetical protein
MTLFASFASREDAIALEILEGLVKLCNERNNNQFKLVLRLSDKKSPRWDQKFIGEQLQSNSDIKRIWACGPP